MLIMAMHDLSLGRYILNDYCVLLSENGMGGGGGGGGEGETVWIVYTFNGTH